MNWVAIAVLPVLVVAGLAYWTANHLRPRPLPKIKLTQFANLEDVAASFSLRLRFELGQNSQVIFRPLPEVSNPGQLKLYASWVQRLQVQLPDLRISLQSPGYIPQAAEVSAKIFLIGSTFSTGPAHCAESTPEKLECMVDLILRTQKKKKHPRLDGFAALIYQLSEKTYYMGLNPI